MPTCNAAEAVVEPASRPGEKDTPSVCNDRQDNTWGDTGKNSERLEQNDEHFVLEVGD